MSVSSRSRLSSSLGPTIEFRAWVLRAYPRHGLVLLFLSGVAAGVALWAKLGLAVALLGAALVWIALWQLWVPIDWSVGPRGITQRIGSMARRVAWHEITGVEHLSDGLVIHLSGAGGKASALRSFFIPCKPDKAQELAEAIDRWLHATLPPSNAMTNEPPSS